MIFLVEVGSRKVTLTGVLIKVIVPQTKGEEGVS
jgi:hypothetical protein